jgi:hypothetical protein
MNGIRKPNLKVPLNTQNNKYMANKAYIAVPNKPKTPSRAILLVFFLFVYLCFDFGFFFFLSLDRTLPINIVFKKGETGGKVAIHKKMCKIHKILKTIEKNPKGSCKYPQTIAKNKGPFPVSPYDFFSRFKSSSNKSIS